MDWLAAVAIGLQTIAMIGTIVWLAGKVVGRLTLVEHVIDEVRTDVKEIGTEQKVQSTKIAHIQGHLGVSTVKVT